MNNIVYTFIKELKEQHVTLRINSIDETVKLTEENRQFIFGAIQQGTFIVPFNQESHAIVMNTSLLEYFPEAERQELTDAHLVPEDL
ncbi:hypothetical protein [Lysinibacillus fusiformis]|uniref:Uncharacterized protein n=1 Tax=Lysinibacillus fusiformis TaxID=28031 RepID=A0A1H9SFW4_9BACI|nr:hypothetical protein [Lysinibacillus fusiformis]SCY83764.1 hypothetical protein SAMN02787081_04690 [Lysinibacillus fusiformis]SEO53310.1 hypothetical protein SAMN02787103_04663 [Lysinibacillus fusiformis]SER83273.1 hypothetical protein SAMN02787113_04695 [Lysinibacillus fusiformis]